MPKFLQISGFKWIDPKEFYLNKYRDNTSTNSVLEIDFEYPKELHNGYHLTSDKIEIKKEMLSKYH